MSQKLQKISLIVIIVLLFLFLPLTGYSFYLNSQSNQVTKEKNILEDILISYKDNLIIQEFVNGDKNNYIYQWLMIDMSF